MIIHLIFGRYAFLLSCSIFEQLENSFAGLKKLCHGDYNIFEAKLSQIKPKYLCHRRNAYRTLKGEILSEFSKREVTII